MNRGRKFIAGTAVGFGLVLCATGAAVALGEAEPTVGYGTGSARALVGVWAVGQGTGSSAIESDTATEHMDDIWRDYDFGLTSDGPEVTGVTFKVPKKTRAMVVMRLSNGAACQSQSNDPLRDTCNMRMLLDGVPVGLVNGSWLPASPLRSDFTQKEAQEFATGVRPGTHRVDVQWGIVNGHGTPMRFATGSTRLIVEVYRQG